MRTALKHEVYMVRFSPTHRWFSFPDMETNEVLLIKGFDSMEDGRARFTAHAAFEDPTAPSRCDTGVALESQKRLVDRGPVDPSFAWQTLYRNCPRRRLPRAP